MKGGGKGAGRLKSRTAGRRLGCGEMYQSTKGKNSTKYEKGVSRWIELIFKEPPEPVSSGFGILGIRAGRAHFREPWL